jgi:hypothetical protein
MTDPDIDPTLGAPDNLPPVSSEDAAEIVQEDEALKAAGRDSGDEDAAADDDARAR